jgi:integrase/recombinase XerC/integrase/recombinase XerD
MLTVIPPAALAQSSDINDLVNDWKVALDLKVKAGELSANTAATYIRGVAKFMGWCEQERIQDVSADTLRWWKASLLAGDKKPATVNVWFSGVKSLLAWGEEQRRLAYNPAKNVKGAKRSGVSRHHSREALTDLEVNRILKQPDLSTVDGKRDAAILALMAFTAVRSVEVVRLTFADVRTQNGRIVLDVTGKGHLDSDSLVVIGNVKAENALYDWLAVRGGEPGPLFPSCSNRSKGEHLSLSALRHLVKAYYKAAGVQGRNKTTHSLRHTAITKAITKGAPLQKVQTMARHESMNTTMVYFHEVDRLTNPAEDFIDYGD